MKIINTLTQLVKSQCMIVLLFGLLPASAYAQFSQMISIGDSLSDVGNTQDVSFGTTPASPNFMGRFSNGQVWNELLAIEVGLSPPTPSRDGGTNYAYGGALTSQDVNITVLFFFTITLPAATSQTFDYLGDVSNVADKDALYTLSIGGNDILEAGEALSVNASAAEIETAKQEMRNIAGSVEVALQQLLDSIPTPGEARVVMLNVPNVGITPRATADGKEAIFQALSEAYNEGLSDVVASLNDNRVLLVDFFAITNDAVANPSSYGFTNVTDRCWSESAGSVCANSDEYLFWDDIHPTSMGHTLLMLSVYQQLFAPDPVNVPIAPVYSWLLLIVMVAVVRRFYIRRLSVGVNGLNSVP